MGGFFMQKIRHNKFVAMLLTLVMALSLLSVTAFAEDGAVASIDGEDQTYPSLQAAVNAAGEGATIRLLGDFTGNGVVVPAGKDITIDFGGYTYDIDVTVGSTGTETNGMQLLQGSKVTLTNGTITSQTAKILIQNYSELTLDNIILDGTQSAACSYTASNNCGSMTVKGNTEILANEGNVAFDLWYGMSNSYAEEGISVTFDESFTGKVDGKIEYGSQRPDESGWEEKTELNINAGNFDIEITQSSANALENANITVGGGAFTAPVDTKFIDASKTAASLTSGENTTYYIGNAESIAQTLADAAKEGDSITVQQGNASFAGIVAGVEVKNEGEGQVVVDDVSVEKGQSTTTTGSAGTEPEPEPESKPESDRDEEEEFGKVEVGGTDSDSNNTDKDNPQTGDDNGLELAIAAMLISAAGAATAFLFKQRKA